MIDHDPKWFPALSLLLQCPSVLSSLVRITGLQHWASSDLYSSAQGHTAKCLACRSREKETAGSFLTSVNNWPWVGGDASQNLKNKTLWDSEGKHIKKRDPLLFITVNQIQTDFMYFVTVEKSRTKQTNIVYLPAHLLQRAHALLVCVSMCLKIKHPPERRRNSKRADTISFLCGTSAAPLLSAGTI